MIRALGEGTYSLFGPDIFEKKSIDKPEWPERDTGAHDRSAIFGEKESSPTFTENGKLNTPERIGRNLSIKI